MSLHERLAPVWWEHHAVGYIDQRRLPHEVRRESAANLDELIEAIRTLAVRGAPCIGIFGAYGVALLRASIADELQFQAAAERLRQARPTAVNLAWAVDRILASSDMLAQAHALAGEQVAVDRAIAEAGLELFGKGMRVLTHCNTGALATGGEGTALGVIIAAAAAGKKPQVYVDETRPLLQGSRLTLFELAQAGVDAILQVDAAAAISMQRNAIDLVIVGADRIARNGDTANKVGTYGLAILAAHHGIPFYVAAPRSTFDFALAGGSDIPIEMRAEHEVTSFARTAVAPEGSVAYNPAFDVTPAHLVSGFITEYGVLRPPYGDALADLESRPSLGALLAVRCASSERAR
ncbi:MAG: S-methyl-5-thioribose-1-phosphate isomerase [Vulcanimicrobiaceae bacterium]